MNIIGKNEQLFNYMSLKNIYLISSVLKRIEIFEDEYILCIELHFKIREYIFKIKFINILEYSFYYREDHNFYNVENCKFFKKGEVFYISLDPYDEKEEINSNDQDFILCKEIEGFI